MNFIHLLKQQFIKWARLAFFGGISGFISYQISLYFQYREPIIITEQIIAWALYYFVCLILFGAVFEYYYLTKENDY